MDCARMQTGRGHDSLRTGLDADGLGTDKDWLRTRMRARPGHGHGLDAATVKTRIDGFRTGRGRGLDTETAAAGLWRGHSASKPRPVADAKTFAGEGVRLVCEIKMSFSDVRYEDRFVSEPAVPSAVAYWHGRDW